jgi:hypothetical protein
VTGAHKQIAGINRYGEWRFSQPKILIIHSVETSKPKRFIFWYYAQALLSMLRWV